MTKKTVKRTNKELEKINKQKQLQREYKKHYNRVKKYVERFSEIGWVIPENLIPPEPEEVTKRQVTKFSKIKIKDFRSKLKKLQSEEVGKFLTGKKAKEVGKQREKEWREQNKQKQLQEIPTILPPQIGIISWLREQIANLPEERWFKGSVHYYFGGQKEMFNEMIDDGLMQYGDNYIQHLLDNQNKFVEEFDIITFESKQEIVEVALLQTALILAYNESLTPMQSERLSEYTEYF